MQSIPIDDAFCLLYHIPQHDKISFLSSQDTTLYIIMPFQLFRGCSLCCYAHHVGVPHPGGSFWTQEGSMYDISDEDEDEARRNDR